MLTEDKYPNWFAVTAQTNFERFLRKLAGQEKLRFLQLGAYTGDASEWLLDNILTDRSCKLIDVDTWMGSEEELHKGMDFSEIYNLYLDRVGGVTEWHRGKTFDYLNGWRDRNTLLDWKFDFVYVDADHTTVGVILDAELSWPLLKSGGIMAFDDYNWGNELPLHLRPRPGIDLFLLRHDGEFELLEKNEQVWIRKH